MRPILKAEEMGKADRLTTERFAIPSLLLMENAAMSVATAAERILEATEGNSVVVVCGKGNNGGDGAAASRLLWLRGASVKVFLLGLVEETKGDARTNFDSVRSLAGETASAKGSLEFVEVPDVAAGSAEILKSVSSSDLVIDAVFGTGLSRPAEGAVGSLLANIQGSSGGKPVVLAVDLPSGLDADEAECIGPHVTADTTITFTAPKAANVLPPASGLNGDLIISDIGTPADLVIEAGSDTWLSETADAADWLAKTEFTDNSYKKTRGTLLLVVGSTRYAGAAVLAANGAMESGVGMVTVAVPAGAVAAISERLVPEVITVAVAETAEGTFAEDALEEVGALALQADAVGIGCGIGSDNEETRKFVRELVNRRAVPFVIDADGLNALAPFGSQPEEAPPLLMTPHQGEFLRLSGSDDTDLLRDRIGAVRRFAAASGAITLLKGGRSIVADPGGKAVVIASGNSGLGKAGNGDNLTGIVSGFVAQASRIGVPQFETVIAAAHLAGIAGDIARGEFGRRAMLASDVRRAFPEALRYAMSQSE